jgi:hypothetical protein
MRTRSVFAGVVVAVGLMAVVPITVSAAEEDSGIPPSTGEVFWLAEEAESRFVTRTGEEFGEEEQPTSVELTTTLSGVAEVTDDGTPGAGDPDGSGTASITVMLNPSGAPTTICWSIAVQNVVTPAAAAHIHEAPAGQNGPIVVPLSAPDLNGTAIGCTTPVEEGLLGRLVENAAGFYVNVHTTDFPAGSVRGQLEGGFGPPSPGDRFFLKENLFASDAAGTKGAPIGHTLVQCTFGLESTLQCDGTAFLDGRGQVHVSATVPFSEESEPFDVAVVGGTDEFATVGGDATITERQVGEDEFVSIYAVRLRELAR